MSAGGDQVWVVPKMTAPDIEISLPEGWVCRTDIPRVLLVGYSASWAGEFVPNIVVTATDVDSDVLVATYFAEQLGGAATTMTDAVLVDAGLDEVARTVDVLVAHEAGGRSVTCRQHHVVGTGGWAIAAAATVADPDWPALAGAITGAVESLRFAR